MWSELHELTRSVFSFEWWWETPVRADATILNVAFALNAGLSVFDQFIKAYVHRKRADLVKKLNECDARLSLASEDSDGEVPDMLLKEFFRLLEMKNRMLDLLLTRCASAKLLLVGAAVLTVFCMCIPCYARSTAFLLLPAPLVYAWCHFEGWFQVGRHIGHLCEAIDHSLQPDDSKKEGEVLSSLSASKSSVHSWAMAQSNALHLNSSGLRGLLMKLRGFVRRRDGNA